MESGRPGRAMRPPSRAPWVILVLLGVAVVVGGVWWLRTRQSPFAEGPTPRTPAAPSTPAAATGPSVDEPGQRALLEAVSDAPAWRRLVAEGDLVRRWAVITENVAEGTVPRKPLAALAPAGGFAVMARGGATFIDPASYRRYDAVADVVAAVNVGALATAYRALRPMLEVAYRGLGYPEGSIDRVTARALARLEKAPVRDGDVAVVEGKGAAYTFADPALEALPDVEKQMLRMGPRNERIVQAKAREIAAALALPPP
jgi:hypothetical protein